MIVMWIGVSLLVAGLGGFWYMKSNEIYRNPRVSIELIPFEAQGFNVRSRVSAFNWERICTIVHKKRNKSKPYRCEQCNHNGIDQGFPHPVECHEIWSFDKKYRIQKLEGFVSLCPMCHKAKHFRLAEKMGYGERVKKHMARQNNWTIAQVEKYMKIATRLVRRQSGRTYHLDLTYLNQPDFMFLKEKFGKDESVNCDVNIKY